MGNLYLFDKVSSAAITGKNSTYRGKWVCANSADSDQEQSNQGLFYMQFSLHLLDASLSLLSKTRPFYFYFQNFHSTSVLSFRHWNQTMPNKKILKVPMI